MGLQILNEQEFELLEQYLSEEEKAELDRLLTDAAAERRKSREDPVYFVKKILKVEDIAAYQLKVLQALKYHRRVCVRSLHGVGKTAMAAWIVLWFVSTHDECKVPTTASAWRQLEEFLWPEIHKWALRADWDRIGLKVRMGRELLTHRIQISDTASAFALNSTDEAKIEGAHSEAILYLFDEAKTIPVGIWDAAEGALSTPGKCYAVAMSTPGESSGRFYDIQTRKPGYEDWHTIHVTLAEAIAEGRISAEWAEMRRKSWGEDSAMYRRRVLGEFADDESEVVIPLKLVERANQRWYDLKATENNLVEGGSTPEEAFEMVWGSLLTIGCDPARLGRDRTGIAYKYLPGIERVSRHEKQDTMKTANQLSMVSKDTQALLKIDPIGIGAGVYDRLRELWMLGEWRGGERHCPAKAVNIGVRTKLTDRTGERTFRNLRDYLWWNMREMLENDEIALPPDDELTEDLVVARYEERVDGMIIVESKDEMRERLPGKRSTDTGDSVLLAYHPDDPDFKPMVTFL